MKKLRSKLNDKAGFSLGEVLVSLLIMTLVSVLLVNGMDTIMHTYRRSVNAANAQTLLSTAITELRSELSFAADVECEDGEISYRNSDGRFCSISNGIASSAGLTADAEMYPGLCITVGSSSRELVSSEASTELVCRIDMDDVSCSKTASTITIGSMKIFEAGKENGNPLATVEDLVISVQTVK